MSVCAHVFLSALSCAENVHGGETTSAPLTSDLVWGYTPEQVRPSLLSIS